MQKPFQLGLPHPVEEALKICARSQLGDVFGAQPEQLYHFPFVHLIRDADMSFASAPGNIELPFFWRTFAPARVNFVEPGGCTASTQQAIFVGVS